MQEDEDVRAMRKQTMLKIRQRALQEITTAQLNLPEFDYSQHQKLVQGAAADCCQIAADQKSLQVSKVQYLKSQTALAN